LDLITKMYDKLRRNLNKSGYTKATIYFTKEEFDDGLSVCKSYMIDEMDKREHSVSGTLMCDHEIPHNYVSCVYDNESGVNPLKAKVEIFMCELLEDRDPKLCQIFLIYQEGSTFDFHNYKQRWHRDFCEEDFHQNKPFIAYVPLTCLEIGVIPSKTGVLNLSSQRRLSISQGDILILNGDAPHREMSIPGSICLLYYFEMRRQSIMYNVVFKTWSCIHCGDSFKSENGKKYHEKKCLLHNINVVKK